VKNEAVLHKKKSRRKGALYIKENEGRLTAVVTSRLRNPSKSIIEGKIEGTGRGGRRKKQLLDDIQ
jgi:hypothetical protein